MKAAELTSIVGPGKVRLASAEAPLEVLLTDSRQLASPHNTLFFAIPTPRNTGCRYIAELYRGGVRNFVVPEADFDGLVAEPPAGASDHEEDFPEANFWGVPDVVGALQRLATWRRKAFRGPVVGITGSNGKTVVKDWAVQLLADDYRIASSPKSYNSQIGVPLSVWQLSERSQMGIFEAGISQCGEMERLEPIISPTIGIFTNIGQAHDENFSSHEQKIAEKLALFSHCPTILYSSAYPDLHKILASGKFTSRGQRLVSWGTKDTDEVQLVGNEASPHATRLSLRTSLLTPGERVDFSVELPFVDRASIENAMHCICLMLLLGYQPDTIAHRCSALVPVEMRMEMKEGINDCVIINDSYSLDLNSLSIALDFMQREAQDRSRTLVISDFVQSGMAASELYAWVAALARQRGVSRLIAIGQEIGTCQPFFEGMEAEFFPSTESFLAQCRTATFRHAVVLLKGARRFQFEKIARVLQRQTHETLMEVNLGALLHNLNYYRSCIHPSTRLMAMVKAASYGAGKTEVARALQYGHADYLTVAYADEGVELRQHGISLPIMVMNPEEEAFDDIITHRLEPDIYSFRVLEAFAARARQAAQRPLPVHIEFDTGMHRLGFGEADIAQLAERLAQLAEAVEVRSVFSHLACSDDPALDSFTHLQIQRFDQWSTAFCNALGQSVRPMRHLLNSSGIARFPEAQFDMVRLGIGLYGISPEPDVQPRLRQVSRLVARISQVKSIPEGDPVGYSGRWVAERPSRIAIVQVGYADGLKRRLGNGRGRVIIRGQEAPIVGNVCMDMCFVDVTDIPEAADGDEVVIFGDGDLLQRNAKAAGTIVYEILTSVSPRVRRVYVQDE